MKKLKSTAALLLALSTAAASLAEAQTIAPWVNYSIIGSVQEDTPADPTDNFFLYVNKDWLLNTPVNPSMGYSNTITERNDALLKELLALVEGEDRTDHDGQLVQTLYRAYTDMDKRNELGIEPLMPYVERIRAIDSIEALNDYLLEDDYLADGFVYAYSEADWKNSEAYAIYLGASDFLLSDADEYRNMTSVGKRRQEALTNLLTAMLLRVGYDEASAQAVIDRAYALDAELGIASMGSSARYDPNYYSIAYNPRTIEELKTQSPVFPLTVMLKEFTDVGIERFIITDFGWLNKLNELYTEENLEALKAVLLVKNLRAACILIDQEGLDIAREADSHNAGTPIVYNMQEKGISLCNNVLGMAMGHMYADAYVSDKMRQDITDIIRDVAAVYRTRLQSTEWLGDETRAKAVEKLDNIRTRVAAPADWSLYDYSSLELPAYEQGGNLIKYIIAIRKHNFEQIIADVQKPINHEKWDMYLTPQTINAFYNPVDNSINILAGILGGCFYDENFSYERKLAGIGLVIGHEITHAFDSTGSQFDAYGNVNNWWTEADRAAFDERTKKVSDYYGSIEVLPGLCQNGQLTIGESVADLGAISCMLEMAKDKPDFDYKDFFIGYGHLWAVKQTREKEENRVQDSHPVDFLRVNCLVQQFEEFYTAFDVKEGDNMYLAPEKRL